MEPLKLKCNKMLTEDSRDCGTPASHEVRAAGHEGVQIIRCKYHLEPALLAARELYGTAVAYRYESRQFTRWGWVPVHDE